MGDEEAAVAGFADGWDGDDVAEGTDAAGCVDGDVEQGFAVDLEEAVINAYGFSPDEDLLAQSLALNLDTATSPRARTWARPGGAQCVRHLLEGDVAPAQRPGALADAHSEAADYADQGARRRR
ncbi:hypothetical protein [Saccharothrix deserti]|uniref:hypothetical protein n=1 Tax=Saccharothrix deserti TaxID=2593674 RepID=UPI0013912A40|nr:hypothetical protein [Saccharothrix deserti]